MTRSRALLTLAAALILPPPSVNAVVEPDEPIACSRLVVKNLGQPWKLNCRGPFTLPASNPPTGGGLAIEVSTIGLGGTQLLRDYIPASAWKALGSPPGSRGYSFRYPPGEALGRCGRGALRDGVIRLSCENLDALVPWSGDAAITVTVSGGNPATDRKVYCGLFGGTEVRNDSIMLKRVRAPAPAVCPPAACGNGTREPQEPCDGADTGSVTCVGLGFGGGTLACNPGCFSYDTSGCTP